MRKPKGRVKTRWVCMNSKCLRFRRPFGGAFNYEICRRCGQQAKKARPADEDAGTQDAFPHE